MSARLSLLLWLLAGAAMAAPPRVVTLAPHATELVIAAGGAGRLVGAVPADAPLPPGTVPLRAHGGLDRERLLALRPDLVVVWRSGVHPLDLAWLRRLDLTLHESEPRGLADIARDLRALGAAMGTGATAERAARAFERAIDTPCRHLPPLAVWVEIWPDPPLTLGGRHWLNDVLSRLGLVNAFAGVDRAVFTPDPEQALALGHLPRLKLRGDGALASPLLARPGPRLAEVIPRLCRQRLRDAE